MTDFMNGLYIAIPLCFLTYSIRTKEWFFAAIWLFVLFLIVMDWGGMTNA